jgi:hypothetical protein
MGELKKCFLVCVVALCGTFAFAQNAIPEPTQDPMMPFRLFRTQNMWTFIELDTVTGKMWQIQFDIGGDNRGSAPLNSFNLAVGKSEIVGRFTLHPTQNIYTFILHDQVDGRTWQVQWSTERNKRLVLPIAE